MEKWSKWRSTKSASNRHENTCSTYSTFQRERGGKHLASWLTTRLPDIFVCTSILYVLTHILELLANDSRRATLVPSLATGFPCDSPTSKRNALRRQRPLARGLSNVAGFTAIPERSKRKKNPDS